MISEINSASNKKFKYFRSLSAKKERALNRQYMVEGVKCVKEALASGAHVDAVIACPERVADIPADIRAPVYVMPKALEERLSYTKTPQGIFAVIDMGDELLFDPRSGGAFVYCDCISDPGNLGTIIRTADSAGFDGVLLSPGCVDAYSPKVVRSCMGSFFHIDIFENVPCSVIAEYKKRGGKIYGGVLSPGSADYRDADYSGDVMIAVGNEANGISEEMRTLCSHIIIPVYGRAESLNAAVAASIMMYECSNSRHGNRQQ